MEGYKQSICTGDWGIPGRYGKKHFIPIDHDSRELRKGLKYWIPEDYNCNKKGSLFKIIEQEIKRGKKNE